VVDVHEDASTITLDIPNAPNIFPTFHTSHIKPFKQNDNSKWPSRTLEKPGPVDFVDGHPEHLGEVNDQALPGYFKAGRAAFLHVNREGIADEAHLERRQLDRFGGYTSKRLGLLRFCHDLALSIRQTTDISQPWALQ